MGINLPVYYNQTFMAVIGITGQPDEVRKYAHLAERITHLLTRERELNTISRNQADKRHFAMEALIHQTSANMDYLNACLKECGIDTTKKYRILLIRAAAEKPSDNLSLLEQKIHQFFEMLSIRLYTFYYPNEYAAVGFAVTIGTQRLYSGTFCKGSSDIPENDCRQNDLCLSIV